MVVTSTSLCNIVSCHLRYTGKGFGMVSPEIIMVRTFSSLEEKKKTDVGRHWGEKPQVLVFLFWKHKSISNHLTVKLNQYVQQWCKVYPSLRAVILFREKSLIKPEKILF